MLREALAHTAPVDVRGSQRASDEPPSQRQQTQTLALTCTPQSPLPPLPERLSPAGSGLSLHAIIIVSSAPAKTSELDNSSDSWGSGLHSLAFCTIFAASFSASRSVWMPALYDTTLRQRIGQSAPGSLEDLRVSSLSRNTASAMHTLEYSVYQLTIFVDIGSV